MGNTTRKTRKTITGPPTQATGPPRSDEEVGVGMLRAAGDPFFSEVLDLEIYQDSSIANSRFYNKNGEARSVWTHNNFKIIHQKVNSSSNLFLL